MYRTQLLFVVNIFFFPSDAENILPKRLSHTINRYQVLGTGYRYLLAVV